MNYTTMKEVTKDEFFGIINEGKLDVLVRPETKEPGHWYPHTTEFKFRDGTVFGKVVEDFHDGEHLRSIQSDGGGIDPCFHGRGFAVCAP